VPRRHLPFAQFEADAVSGDLPDFSFIEPCLVLGHGDYHPAVSRALGHGIVLEGVDPPSSILGGEAFLTWIYDAYKSMRSPRGANVWNTSLLIGWDEPGGTYDHVAPGFVPPPDASAAPGQLRFAFDRSGYRVPALFKSRDCPPAPVLPCRRRRRCTSRTTSSPHAATRPPRRSSATRLRGRSGCRIPLTSPPPRVGREEPLFRARPVGRLSG
jgi:hypothetical protein